MNAQRKLNVEVVNSYRTLINELCEIYSPASKSAIADYIGISQKTIYNIIYGEVVGVYTQKKLMAFLLNEFNYQIKNVKDSIVLERTVGGLPKAKAEMATNNFIMQLLEETNRKRDEIKELKDELEKLRRGCPENKTPMYV